MNQVSEDEAHDQDDGSKDDLFSPKKTSRAVRVLTVVAYVLSVSLAAILLSLYYVFLWDPKVPGAIRRVAQPQPLEGPPPCQHQAERYIQPQEYSMAPPVIQYLAGLSYGPRSTSSSARDGLE